MSDRTATVATENASRYLQALCKHWSHKFAVTFDTQTGHIPLPMGDVALTADAAMLTVVLKPKPDADADRMQAVVEEHLNRFAFREAPLPFVWQ